MSVEKQSSAMPASLRMVGLGLASAVVIFGIGYAANQVVGDKVAKPDPTPSPTPITVESPTPLPTAFASPTAPTPSPSPTASAASVSEARAAYQAKDYKKAITLFTMAIAEAQGDVAVGQLSYELGNSYREDGQISAAIAAYEKANKVYPTLVAAWQAHANIHIAQGEKDIAKTILEDGLKANPGNQDLQRDLSTLQLSGPSEP